MSTWMKIGHWTVNALLMIGAFYCFYLGIFQGENVGIVNRALTFACGAGLAAFAFWFTIYTLKRG